MLVIDWLFLTFSYAFVRVVLPDVRSVQLPHWCELPFRRNADIEPRYERAPHDRAEVVRCAREEVLGDLRANRGRVSGRGDAYVRVSCHAIVTAVGLPQYRPSPVP